MQSSSNKNFEVVEASTATIGKRTNQAFSRQRADDKRAKMATRKVTRGNKRTQWIGEI